MATRKYRKKLMLQTLTMDDVNKGTSNVRELEMMVDSIVAFQPAYAAQFFQDCRLYGIDEAKGYLIRFVEKSYQNPDDLAMDIAKLSEKIEQLHETYGTAR